MHGAGQGRSSAGLKGRSHNSAETLGPARAMVAIQGRRRALLRRDTRDSRACPGTYLLVAAGSAQLKAKLQDKEFLQQLHIGHDCSFLMQRIIMPH